MAENSKRKKIREKQVRGYVVGTLHFQLLHVLAAGPRISKTLDNIVQMVLLLCGLDFALIVIHGWSVNYPMLPHRSRGGTSNGILGY